jgi:MFS family permease
MDGYNWDGSLKQDSFKGFAIAIVLFALATSLFFTPLPIYLKEVFNGQEQYVYLAYILNSVGATIGYFLIRGKARSIDIRKNMPRFIFIRSLLVFALVGIISYAILPVPLTFTLLVCLGFAYAMYYIMMLSLSMEIIPEGKAGLFDGMVSLGAGTGAIVGPLIAQSLSYDLMFFITAILFLVAFLAIKVIRR